MALMAGSCGPGLDASAIRKVGRRRRSLVITAWAPKLGHLILPVHRAGLILSGLWWGPHIMQNSADPGHRKTQNLPNDPVSPTLLSMISVFYILVLLYWGSFSWPILTMMMLETTYWCYQNFDCLLHFLSLSYNSSFSYRVPWPFVSGLEPMNIFKIKKDNKWKW